MRIGGRGVIDEDGRFIDWHLLQFAVLIGPLFLMLFVLFLALEFLERLLLANIQYCLFGRSSSFLVKLKDQADDVMILCLAMYCLSCRQAFDENVLFDLCIIQNLTDGGLSCRGFN